MNILLLTYNNYFNRIVKKESSTADYRAASIALGSTYLDIPSVDFNPNDGVVTELIVGKGNSPYLNWEIGAPDYLVTYETVNSVENIKHRWFILEAKRTRGGQYRLTLKRDILADFYDDFKNAPCYIEKAMITDTLNPLLYNKEGLGVNQIKSAEYLLKDRSGVAWVVGYVARNLTVKYDDSNFGAITLSAQGTDSDSFYYDKANLITNMWISNLDGYVRYTGLTWSVDSTTQYVTYSINNSSLANTQVVLRFTRRIGTQVSNDGYTADLIHSVNLEDAPYDMFCIPFGEIHLESANITTTKESALAIALGLSQDIGTFLYDVQLLPYCPRIDVVGDNNIYEILMSESIDYSYIKDGSDNVKNILIWCDKSSFSGNAMPDTDIQIERQVENELRTATVSSNNARVITVNNYSTVSLTDSSIAGLSNVTVTAIQVSKGSYNASSSGVTDSTYNEVLGGISGKIYTPSFQTGTSSGWTATITYTYKKYKYPKYLDFKVSNECDLFRLVSPNYNGQFEWSLAKGNGTANIFDIDCTYKPFQPYIHVQPIFTNLYGSDFDDARGLICGGDFSLPIISDAWVQYQIQNKTYQEMFDRNIWHMDVQQGYQQSAMGVNQMTSLTNGIMGTASSAAGAKNGYQAGAAIVTGAIKTGMGALGSELQREYQAAAYQDTRQFTIDMFNYSLQNVQALPYNLTKVAAYTANNKIFPMVEYYTCKEVEKQALRDKIQYNGMTVMVIGKISDYVDANEQRFIKGQLIRLPSIKEDSHVADEIYNEINKGAFI